MIHNILSLFPGVPLFFLTSGFLITDSFLNSSNIKEYFIKRGFRIYPALFICIVILEISMYMGGNINNNLSFLQYLIYFVTYVFTASSGISTTLIGVDGLDIYNFKGFFDVYPSGVLWTLTVELSFYIILPLILVFKNTIVRNITLIALFIVSILISNYASEELYASSGLYKLLNISFLPYIWIFIIGIASRLYWKNIYNILKNRGALFLVIYLLFSYISYSYFSIDLGIGYKYSLDFTAVIKVVLLSISILSLAFSYTDIKFNLTNDLSYATYLYHMLFVQVFMSLGLIGEWKYFFIIVGFTLFIAYLSWNYIEAPILKLKGRFNNVK